MKREFAFEDALRMLEVMWSSLPFKTRSEELKLFEHIPEFNPVTKPIPLPRQKDNPYTKVCALRRQGSSSGSASSPTGQLDPAYRHSHQNRSSCSSWERKGDSDIYRRSKATDESATKYVTIDSSNSTDSAEHHPTIAGSKSEFDSEHQNQDSKVLVERKRIVSSNVDSDAVDESSLLLNEKGKKKFVPSPPSLRSHHRQDSESSDVFDAASNVQP